jgi:hypothetical protein
MQIGNTDRTLVDAFLPFGGSVTSLKRYNGKAHWRDAWVWKICGKPAQDVACQLLPYLRGEKQHEAEIFAIFPIGTRGRHLPPFAKIAQAAGYQELRKRHGHQRQSE